MGRRSSVTRVAPEVRKLIEKMLVEDRHTFDEIVEAVRHAHPDQIIPSRSAIHRYGQRLHRRLDAIRASTEASRIISEQVGDEKDTRSEAIIALVQSEFFEVIVNLQESQEVDEVERVKLLSAAAKNIATLTRASVTLKTYQAEVADKIRDRLDALEKDAEGKKGGFDLDTLRRVREEIYGIIE